MVMAAFESRLFVAKSSVFSTIPWCLCEKISHKSNCIFCMDIPSGLGMTGQKIGLMSMTKFVEKDTDLQFYLQAFIFCLWMDQNTGTCTKH